MNIKWEMSKTVVSLLCIASFGIWNYFSYNYGYTLANEQAKEKIVSAQKQIVTEQDKLGVYKEELNNRQIQLARTEQQLKAVHKSFEQPHKPGWSVSDAQITAYTPLDDRNGINSDGEGEYTSIGMRVGYGRFAVDPKRIPYGSDMLIVYPDGSTEQGIAADTGGALRKPGKLKIDVFRETFDQGMSFGRKDAIVLWKAPSK